MCVLTALVGINYMIICRLYPDGGGVYASVRHRSEVISIVGAFLLIADYLVTAAISALSAFQYLGVPHPEKFAAAAILIIGLLQLARAETHRRPRLSHFSSDCDRRDHARSFQSAAPRRKRWRICSRCTDSFWQNWAGFVGIVLALSGVEAIANATGVMKLDPGSTESESIGASKHPRPQFWWS